MSSQEIIDEHLRAVVINETSYRNALLELDQSFWALQLDIPDERDFGMIKFDFRQVKD